MKTAFSALLLVITIAFTASALQRKPPFSVVEASISDMQQEMKEGRVTSREIVVQYLTRIAMYNKTLNAVISVNPNAIKEAEQLDLERAQGRIRGPLHGIPIALKDNIQTTNMPTTGGALAFRDYIPPYEATLTKNLRDAGAIIIAKTTMTELAGFVGAGMPPNYNAVAGFGMNPYDPRIDPREATFDGRAAMNPGGSSSGAGTAANFWAGNVGTETYGSVLIPANQNMLVGIKPTVGRVSRYGVIPITADQDTPGPMAKTVTDAAIILGALENSLSDPGDPATQRCTPPPNRDYRPFLKTGGLKGSRIGVPRLNFYVAVPFTGDLRPRSGLTGPLLPLSPEQSKLMGEVIDVLKKEGAVVIDPVTIPSISDKDPNNNFLGFSGCGVGQGKGHDGTCSVVLKYGMKRDFNKWLASLGSSSPVKTLTDLREWNLAHQKVNAIKYGQSLLDIADEMDIVADRGRYEQDRANDLRLAGADGIDAAMKANNLDALLFPSIRGIDIAARPGYPTVIVPAGVVPNTPNPPFPPGFNAQPAPFGVSFTGTTCSEPKLISIAYAFEQATKERVPPPNMP